MTKVLAFVLAFGLSAAALAQPATTPLDGSWRGTSDGGSCNAPLDYVINIEAGLVDGSAFDTTARGPQPNLKKAPPPAPGAGLWQIYGVAKGDAFPLRALASTKGANRLSEKLSVAVQGNAMTVTESGGCGRTARLSRG